MSVKRNVFVWIVVQLLQVSIGSAAGRLLQEPVSGRDQLLRIFLAWSRLAMHDVSHQKAGVEEASDELKDPFTNCGRWEG